MEDVTAAEVSAIASGTECDQIYFLRGSEDEEETEEQEQDGE